MANAAPKKRPMRSRRSGVKKFKQYMSNWEILKKLGAFVLVVMFFTSCVPVRYVYIDPKDSTVHKQRVIHSDIYLNSTPLYFNYYRPYYIPQRIIVPVRPQYRPMPPRGRH